MDRRASYRKTLIQFLSRQVRRLLSLAELHPSGKAMLRNSGKRSLCESVSGRIAVGDDPNTAIRLHQGDGERCLFFGTVRPHRGDHVREAVLMQPPHGREYEKKIVQLPIAVNQ